MSIEAIRYVWDSYVDYPGSPAIKLLYLALADFASKFDGRCWASIPTLAKKCGLSQRHTQKLLRKLEKQEEIEVVIGGGASTKHGPTNGYRLVKFIAARGEPQFTPSSKEVKYSSPVEGQEVNPGSSQGVNPSSPKPLKEPLKEKMNHKAVSSDTGELSLEGEGRDLTVDNQDSAIVPVPQLTPAIAPQQGPTVSAAPQADTLTTVKVSPTVQPDWWGAAWGQLAAQYPLLKAECLPFLKLVEADVGSLRFVFEATNRRAYELALRGEASFRRVVADVGGLSFEAVQVEVRETAPAAAGATRFGQMARRIR